MAEVHNQHNISDVFHCPDYVFNDAAFRHIPLSFKAVRQSLNKISESFEHRSPKDCHTYEVKDSCIFSPVLK